MWGGVEGSRRLGPVGSLSRAGLYLRREQTTCGHHVTTGVVGMTRETGTTDLRDLSDRGYGAP